MRFKKSFGQNFLRDKNFIRKIVSSLPSSNNVIVEIGPGSGQITRHLISKASMLYCVEKDRSLVNLLRGRFSIDSVEFINKDILTLDLSFLKTKAIVFGNVPFNISNQLIRYLVRNKGFIREGYFTFQKEFARKLTALPGTKDYGYLSCFTQYYADVRIIFDISKEAFYPVPGVDASFVKIVFYNNLPLKVKDEEFLFKLIRTAFSTRRKKIVNSLAPAGEKKDVEKALKSVNINGSLRPDSLSLKDYCNLCNALFDKDRELL